MKNNNNDELISRIEVWPKGKLIHISRDDGTETEIVDVSDKFLALAAEVKELREAVKQIRYYASQHDPVCDCDMCEIYKIIEAFKEKNG